MRIPLLKLYALVTGPHLLPVEEELARKLAPIVARRLAASGAIGAALAGVLVDLLK
jgi:hypothetical protein